jgi:hypothetical protein
LTRQRAQAVVPTISVWGVRGIAVDSSGIVFISDQTNHVIWLFNSSNGNLRVFAGLPGTPGAKDGLGSAARFRAPGSLSMSDDEQLINCVDTGNSVIRQIGRDGSVVTLGGTAP